MRILRSKMRVLILALFAVSTLSLVACNTMHGAGEDIEKAGESVQDAAD